MDSTNCSDNYFTTCGGPPPVEQQQDNVDSTYSGVNKSKSPRAAVNSRSNTMTLPTAGKTRQQMIEEESVYTCMDFRQPNSDVTINKSMTLMPTSSSRMRNEYFAPPPLPLSHTEGARFDARLGRVDYDDDEAAYLEFQMRHQQPAPPPKPTSNNYLRRRNSMESKCRQLMPSSGQLRKAINFASCENILSAAAEYSIGPPPTNNNGRSKHAPLSPPLRYPDYPTTTKRPFSDPNSYRTMTLNRASMKSSAAFDMYSLSANHLGTGRTSRVATLDSRSLARHRPTPPQSHQYPSGSCDDSTYHPKDNTSTTGGYPTNQQPPQFAYPTNQNTANSRDSGAYSSYSSGSLYSATGSVDNLTTATSLYATGTVSIQHGGFRPRSDTGISVESSDSNCSVSYTLPPFAETEDYAEITEDDLYNMPKRKCFCSFIA